MNLELKNRKGQRIVADLEKPEGAVKGTCIIEHGWGAHRKKSTILAIKKGFLESGFQVFVFDVPNSSNESEGKFEDSTLTTFAEDLEDVVKWVENQEWFVKPLALSGHSKGGYSVVRYAQKHPSEVDFLVPIAPVVSGKLSFETNMKRDAEGFARWKETGTMTRTGRDGKVYVHHWRQMEERLNHDLVPDAKKLTMLALFIVGSKDESCPPEHIRILFDALPEGKKDMKIIEGSAHSFYEEDEKNACTQTIKEWLAKQ